MCRGSCRAGIEAAVPSHNPIWGFLAITIAVAFAENATTASEEKTTTVASEDVTKTSTVGSDTTVTVPPTAAATSTAAAASLQSWSYKDTTQWPEQGYPYCTPPEEQSPIDIDTSLNSESVAQALQHSAASEHGRAKVALLNWTVKVFWPEAAEDEAKVTWQGENYFLTSFHFHAPSENTIDGKHADMEVEHLHTALDGRRLVLSVLLHVHGNGTDANSYLDHLAGLFNEHGDENEFTTKVRVPYDELLPADGSYYSWIGTRTQPPCDPHVIWVLMKRPVTMAASQLSRFRDRLSSVPDNALRTDSQPPEGVSSGWDATKGVNNRPTNPLGSRVMQMYNDPNAPDSSSPTNGSRSGAGGFNWGSLTNSSPDALTDALSEQMHEATENPSRYWWVWATIASVLACVFFCPLCTILYLIYRRGGGSGSRKRKKRRRPYRQDSQDEEDVRPLVQYHQPQQQLALPYPTHYR